MANLENGTNNLFRRLNYILRKWAKCSSSNQSISSLFFRLWRIQTLEQDVFSGGGGRCRHNVCVSPTTTFFGGLLGMMASFSSSRAPHCSLSLCMWTTFSRTMQGQRTGPGSHGVISPHCPAIHILIYPSPEGATLKLLPCKATAPHWCIRCNLPALHWERNRIHIFGRHLVTKKTINQLTWKPYYLKYAYKNM